MGAYIRIPYSKCVQVGPEAGLKGMLKLAYIHIKWGLIWKHLTRAFSRRPWIPSTHRLNSISTLFKCVDMIFHDNGWS